jgi:CRISPR/Cas system-associated exonuclease Cas4 (RecB family)
MDDVLRRSIEEARQCVEGIARGEFPLTDPENSEKVCTYCQYKTICRIQTVRYVRSQEKESV